MAFSSVGSSAPTYSIAVVLLLPTALPVSTTFDPSHPRTPVTRWLGPRIGIASAVAFAGIVFVVMACLLASTVVRFRNRGRVMLGAAPAPAFIQKDDRRVTK